MSSGRRVHFTAPTAESRKLLSLVMKQARYSRVTND